MKGTHIATHFRRDERGAALVEFAIALPLVLVVFATIVEGSRLFWSYQATVAGVRDAARYVARVAATDSCSPEASFAGYKEDVELIVRNAMAQNSLFPSGVLVSDVEPELVCVDGDFRISPAPVAQVTATLAVTFPFAGVFALVGSSLGSITTTVTDQSRVFGS
ncbi:TadE/TadG family type IV pilus assembly protein [Sinisalibacter aestuarii]|uniref:TadE/TadG family type IV pilus assembly protein n=1 Tax=Sinisalibacter aestuarii TaxID=2949426 RepID=UPI0024929336|nr:TadE family protein [Sinisalibacter aestuarii]